MAIQGIISEIKVLLQTNIHSFDDEISLFTKIKDGYQSLDKAKQK